MRILIFTLLSIFIIHMGLPGTAAAAPPTKPLLNIRAESPGPLERTYFYTPSGNSEHLLTVRQALIDRGARRVVCFLPFTVVAELPPDLEYQSALAGTDIVASLPEHIPPAVAGDYVGTPQWVKKCYQRFDQDPELAPPAGQASPDFDAFKMVSNQLSRLPSRKFPFSRTETDETPRAYNQNTEFLLGDILIQLVFPESIGNDQNWSDGALSTVSSQLTQVILYYQHLFSYTDIRFVVRTQARVPTKYEPINFTRENQRTWISDVMTNLGYSGTESEFLNQVHRFNEEWRVRIGTDWVFTAFVVNSAWDFDHLFANARYFGFSQLGGPHLALPYPCGDSNVFTPVFKHEMGRVFWAHYESVSPTTNCGSRSGYLNGQNWNKTISYTKGSPEGCSRNYVPVPCVMNITDMTEYYFDGQPCDYTATMMGISDLNMNNIPDVFDAPPTIQFETARRETIWADSFQFRCQAVSHGVANMNPLQNAAIRKSYALPIKDVSYNVNSVGPIQLAPEDGKADETTEDFLVEINTLLPGLTTIDVRSRNTMGATSDWTQKQVYYVGLSYKQVKFIQSNDGIKIQWYMLGETFGAKFDLHRIDPATGENKIVALDVQPISGPEGLFLPYDCFDDDVVPGRTYRYYIEGYFPFVYRGEQRDIVNPSAEFEITASLQIDSQQILSAPSPNPCRGVTSISINVPATLRDAGTQGNSPGKPAGNFSRAAQLQETVPTWVTVKVFNVAGQKVRDLFRERLYPSVHTVVWDATNNEGQRVPTGLYFFRVEAGPYVKVRKVLVLR